MEEKTEIDINYLVLDTNILLFNANNLHTLSQDGTVLVIPDTVLEEIDNKKTLLNELGWQAREFGRILGKTELLEIKKEEFKNEKLNNIQVTTARLKLKSGGEINLVFAPTESSKNDDKIVEMALILKMHYPTLQFMTNDTNCKYKALARGLSAIDYKVTENVDVEFMKHVIIEDNELFRTLDQKMIKDIVTDHEANFYSYKFENLGQVKLANIINNKIHIINKDLEKEIRHQDINPMNAEQQLMSHAIQDPNIDILVCEAKAGSGKTAVAVSNAIRLVSKHHFDGITYIRNSIDDVEPGEDIGYLSGNDEKMAVYLHALHDTIEFIARNRIKKKSNEKREDYEFRIEQLIEEINTKNDIEAILAYGTRGRTFIKRVIIIDEAQNLSDATMQKLLTRVGKGCKVIIIGSNRQIDNTYLTKFNNGLSTLTKAACEDRTEEAVSLYAIRLKKILRGPVAEFAEILFSRK